MSELIGEIDIVKTLLGQLAWHVERGHGSFITMQFGDPVLEVREPKVGKKVDSEKVTRLLACRKVSVLGAFHLWVQYADWEIICQKRLIAHSKIKKLDLDSGLKILDGQRLLSVSSENARSSVVFKFDLESELIVTYGSYEESQPLVSFYDRNGFVGAIFFAESRGTYWSVNNP